MGVTSTHYIENIGTYYYTIVALKFVEVSRGSRVEVAVINVLTGKDTSEEFQDRGLPETNLFNKKDGV